MLVALCGLCVGGYALLDPTVPGVLGIPMVVFAVCTAGAGLALGGKRVRRTQYRPDPWLMPEWITALSGAIAATTMIVANNLNPGALAPSVYPLAWPTLPLLPVVGLAIAALPAFLTPVPPRTTLVVPPSPVVDLTPSTRRERIPA